jgi:hypothetical protein
MLGQTMEGSRPRLRPVVSPTQPRAAALQLRFSPQKIVANQNKTGGANAARKV